MPYPMQGMLQPQFSPESQPGGGQVFGGAPQAQPGMPPQGISVMEQMQPSPEMGTFGADQQTATPEAQENYINYAISQANLAKGLNKTQDGKDILREMGNEIVARYLDDEDSRKPWMEKVEEWTKLATLVRDVKTYPWPKASNIKYPLLATAAMQFSARAYPALVPSSGRVVKTKISQKDPQDQVYIAADRVGQHMSYQILERIENWEEDMDKLLMTMAIVGISFKKTYYDSARKRVVSEFIPPERLCVNYHARSLERAYLKTEILHYNDNEVKEKVNNNEEYLDIDFSAPTNAEKEEKIPVVSEVIQPPAGKSTPHIFLSASTYWDLDGDGYEEPYVIVVHKATRQVVRIIARWSLAGVKQDETGKIISIEPIEYYTDFPFIPNPDGSIYALGFGILLGPINESCNTLINQLVDSGTLNNLQSGFIGKGLRLRMGQTSLQPGEFKVVNATGDDLKKSIYMLETKEPSSTLMSLLQLLIQSGNQLASIAEIFVGKMPGQNTPATTTQETIQQGMAVFTAVYKRVYRSLSKEFKKIFFWNKICPDIVEEESKIAGIQLLASDYDLPDWAIIPGADPTGDSTTTRMAKLQQAGQLLQLGTIDPMLYTKMFLDTNEIPNAQQLMRQPAPPPPDPKQAQIQAKMQIEQQKAQGDQQGAQMKLSIMQQETQNKVELNKIEAERLANRLRHEQQMQALDEQGKQLEIKSNMVLNTIAQQQDIAKASLDTMRTLMKAQHDDKLNNLALAQQNNLASDKSKRQTLTLDAQKARAKVGISGQKADNITKV